MAQFDANINLNVNNREALKGVTQVEGAINKLVKGVKEFERIFNDALNPKAAVQSRFQLDQERKALTLFNQQNAALQNQVRLAAELGRAYDKLQVKIVGGELVRAEKARNAQKALPGAGFSGQRALPAAGQTGGNATSSPFVEAQRVAAAIDKLNAETVKEKARGNNAVRRTADAREKIARAAEGEVSRVTRTAPPGSGPAAGVGSRGASGERFRAKLEQQVAREISASGKLTRETEELVNTFNKRQNVGDKLIAKGNELVRITDQQVDAAKDQKNKSNKNQKKQGGGGGGAGGGGAGGGLAAGIGFPLLFGGGPGSVIGGAVGSAGGFGTQILASAIGGIIDQTIANVAKLGQALNPLTADIDAIVEAAGESNTAFGQLVKDLEKVAGKEAALAAATAQLVNVIGQDGVTALRQFGEDTSALGNEVSIALSQAAGAVAELVNNLGFLTAIIGSIQQDNLSRAAKESSDPEIKRLRKERKSIAANDSSGLFGDFFGDDLADKLAAQDKLIAARQLELQLIEERNIKEEAGVAAAEAKAAASNVEINSLKAQIALEESGLDLTTEAGVALAEKVIEQQTYVALQAAINSGLFIEAIRLNETLEKLRLKARAVAEREAAQRKAEAAARKAANEQTRLAREAEQARKAELRVQQQLAQYQIADYDLAIQQIRLSKGEDAALKEQIKNQDALLAQRINVINLSDKDQRLKDKEIAMARIKQDIEKTTLKNKRQEIALQAELNRLKGEQQVDAVQTGLNQELAGLTIGEDDSTELLREQGDRYANTLRDINNQIEQQNLLIENTPTPNQEAINAATAQLDVLNKTKGAYEAMLPQIFAAEQAQLKFNQTFAAVTPAVNSLVGGLREVVAGTKTAEEAFADFLNTIADQLIQTAATMIAQYIAIGIAKAFAFGGNPSPKGTLPGTNFFEGRTPGLATGGTAEGGQAYIVGEKGPELFIPGVTGTVTNNDQFEAARKAMGGSNNSSSDAFADNAEAIGTSTSYTKEKVMERERIASINSNPIDVRAETTVINNVEYVTVEQFSQGMKSTARDAQAKVLSDLRNRPATRAQVGIR